MEESSSKSKIWLFLTIILVVAAVFAGGIWFYQQMLRAKAQNELDELAEQMSKTSGVMKPTPSKEDTEVSPKEEAADEPDSIRGWEDYTLEEKYQSYFDIYGIEIPQKDLDFAKLQTEVNADIYAWICVPGTKVDYPVVQHPTDDSYYLNYNLNGSKGYPGGIYTESSCNAKDFSDRMTVIYGHNMKDGTAFGSLHQFEKKDFFDENRYIFIYTPDDIFVYEIFAAYEGSDVHIIRGHEWDDETWIQYLEGATLPLDSRLNQSLDSYQFDAKDKVLTLSTCIRNAPAWRYLVQGVLLDEGRNMQYAYSD